MLTRWNVLAQRTPRFAGLRLPVFRYNSMLLRQPLYENSDMDTARRIRPDWRERFQGGADSQVRVEETKKVSRPTRTLFVHGIGQRVSGGDVNVVSAIFNAFANVTHVRMCTSFVDFIICLKLIPMASAQHYSHVDVASIEQAVAIMKEHRVQPFEYRGTPLRIDFASAEISGSESRVLHFAGFTGGEQRLRHMLERCEGRVEHIRIGMQPKILHTSWLTPP